MMSYTEDVTFAAALSKEIEPRTLYKALMNGDIVFVNNFADITAPDPDEVLFIKNALEEFSSMLSKRRKGSHSKQLSQYWSMWEMLLSGFTLPPDEPHHARMVNPLFRTIINSERLQEYGLENLNQKSFTYNLPVRDESQKSVEDTPNRTKFDSESGSENAKSRWIPLNEEKKKFAELIKPEALRALQLYGEKAKEEWRTDHLIIANQFIGTRRQDAANYAQKNGYTQLSQRKDFIAVSRETCRAVDERLIFTKRK